MQKKKKSVAPICDTNSLIFIVMTKKKKKSGSNFKNFCYPSIFGYRGEILMRKKRKAKLHCNSNNILKNGYCSMKQQELLGLTGQ